MSCYPHRFCPPRFALSSSSLLTLCCAASVPLESLLPQLSGAGGPGGKGAGAGPLASLKSLPGWQVPTQEDLTRHRLYRPLGEACEVRLGASGRVLPSFPPNVINDVTVNIGDQL